MTDLEQRVIDLWDLLCMSFAYGIRKRVQNAKRLDAWVKTLRKTKRLGRTCYGIKQRLPFHCHPDEVEFALRENGFTVKGGKCNADEPRVSPKGVIPTARNVPLRPAHTP